MTFSRLRVRARWKPHVVRGLIGAKHPVSYRQRQSANGAEAVRVGADERLRALSEEIGAMAFDAAV